MAKHNKIILVLAFFGIIFTGVLLEEAFHILHAQANGHTASAVCLGFNIKVNQSGYLYAFTMLDKSEWGGYDQYDSWAELTEKYAILLTTTWSIILGTVVGYYARLK